MEQVEVLLVVVGRFKQDAVVVVIAVINVRQTACLLLQ